MAEFIPVEGLFDFFFRNLPTRTAVGLTIFTDQSISSQGPNPDLSTATQETIQAVSLKVIPQNINFVQKSRISEQTIKDGRAFFFWKKDPDANHLDLMEIQMSGMTLSLSKEGKKTPNAFQQVGQGLSSLFTASASAPPEGADKITQKQKDWLKFWMLTREPFVTATGINRHHIYLKTPALPSGVEFIGHFAGPVDFDEVANNPFIVTWRLRLIVHETIPELDSLFTLASQPVIREPVAV